MKVKDETQGKSQALFGALILIVGVAIGLLLQPPSTPAEIAKQAAGERSFARSVDEDRAPWDGERGAPPDNGLRTLHLELPQATRTKLAENRARAMEFGLIITDDATLSPARARFDGEWQDAEVRLKGDFLDHVDTHKWSLRVELSGGKLAGMSRFSLHHPKIRGFLIGWLALAGARQQGLLAPRSSFVNLVIDGVPNGVYQLEEHFTKELLESAGRREGPIVRFSEESFWGNNLQNRTLEQPAGGTGLRVGNPAFVAEVLAYGEKKLGKDAQLNARLQRALGLLRELQRSLIAESTHDLFATNEIESDTPLKQHETMAAIKEGNLTKLNAPSMARIQALRRARTGGVDEIMDIEMSARVLGWMNLLNARHGAAWHNMRFYHDPVTDRLEPMVFDTGASVSKSGSAGPLVWESSLVGGLLAQSEDFYVESFRQLRRYADPALLEELEEAFGEELLRYEAALRAEGILPPHHDVATLWNGLRYRQATLRQALQQSDPVNYHCRMEVHAEEGMVQSGTLSIEAWSTTRVPVVLEGFRFSNGDFVAARPCLEEEDRLDANYVGEAVILPWDGRRYRFRLAIDERLATLRAVERATAAIKQRKTADLNVRLELRAVSRLLGDEATSSEQLALRRTSIDGWQERGRPASPSLVEALERHECLDFDLDTNRLMLRTGAWKVTGDLLIPDGMPLHAGPGVRLAFEAGAVLVSSGPLQFSGSRLDPVVLEAADPEAAWGGVLVLDAGEKSIWTRVEVRGASELARGGWGSTGGVTFYRSPVELRGCAFIDARGEDALNIFGTGFLLEECRFQGAVSDAFDGDFVDGVVRNCEFSNIEGDGVDFSGSRVRIADCTMRDIGDKAISVGERTQAIVRSSKVERAAIGLAVKDASTADVQGLRIVSARQYGIAAYVKKPEYGPCVIRATEVQIENPGRGDYLVQEGCELTLNGVLAETEVIDVEELYAEGILGN